MSAIGWFKRVILETDPDDGGLGGLDNFGGEDDDRKINVSGGTKQSYTRDDDYSYVESYVSASSKKSGNEADTTGSQGRKMQSGNITPVTGRSSLNISLMTPKRLKDDGMYKAIQMLRDEGHAIILNLENCEEKRGFVSFAIKLAGGVNDHVDNVSRPIYVLMPKNVELSGDFGDVKSQVAQTPRSKPV